MLIGLIWGSFCRFRGLIENCLGYLSSSLIGEITFSFWLLSDSRMPIWLNFEAFLGLESTVILTFMEEVPAAFVSVLNRSAMVSFFAMVRF